MGQIVQDLRYGVRMLGRSPGLTLVIVTSLALGIGANSAVFSVADALLLKPLPYPQPDRLVNLWERSLATGVSQVRLSLKHYLDIQRQNRVFEDMALALNGTSTLTGLQQPELVEGLSASSSLLRLLGAKPLLGRLILADEDKPGKLTVAVLTHGLWKRLFGADPHIVGKSITLNGQPVTVVGVLGPEFLLNNEIMPIAAGMEKVEILLSLPMPADAVQNTRYGYYSSFNVMARLKPGVSLRQAEADLDAIASRMREAEKLDRTFAINLVPLREQVVGNVRRAMIVLLGAVALVLLIACANVANLLLSRAAGRQKEIAIRAALGAGGTRLARQLLTESALLGLLGGSAGLLIAAWSLSVLRSLNPGNIPRLDAIALDGRALAFTFGVSILTGLVFGLAPAVRAASVDLNSALKASGRAPLGGGGLHISRHRLRTLLVISELAFSLMLLTGAGLLIRSFLRLQTVSPGFNPDRVLSMRLSLSGPKYYNLRAVAPTYQDMLTRIGSLPGVKASGAVSTLPFAGTLVYGRLEVEGHVSAPGDSDPPIDQRSAAGAYFRTMEIPLLKGRLFGPEDSAGNLPVTVIDDKMAQRFWPAGDPIGKRVRQGQGAPWRTIVGVVGSVKQYGLDVDQRMAVYFPHAQFPRPGMYLVARTSANPELLAKAVIGEIHAVDPNLPVYAVRTMEERIHQSLARQRFLMTMLASFAGFAMLLGGVGVYGVMSYLVTRNTHDIGVRIALGAPRASILRTVIGQGMAMAGAGIGTGLLGAAALTRVMATLLFGVSATDALTFSAVAAFLGTVALIACFVPAYRATRVDPLTALREE